MQREMNFIYKRISVRLTADYFAEKIRPKGWGKDIPSIQRKNCQPPILYSAKLYFKNKSEINTSLNKQKQ